MPDRKTIARARSDRREGKAPSTQAGEFVREEMEHVRGGKHGARSTKQAIAIGLSKARRAGVRLPAPRKGKASARTRASARRALPRGGSRKSPSRTRSRAVSRALRREGHRAASPPALARQAHRAAMKRSASERSRSARMGARKRSPAERSRAAREAARTRKHK
ncbi:MAG: DUF6496 domain-containing protein [Syntrophomonadaceae bacterium]